MSRKARIWVGGTLFVVIALNYAIIGFPLLGKRASLEEKYKVTLTKEVKSGRLFSNAETEYMLEIFRKERAAVGNRILLLNLVSASLAIIAASWTIFGLIFHKGK